MNFDSGARRTAQTYACYRTPNVMEFTQFSNEPRADNEDSGTFSPPLWKSNGLPTGSGHCHDEHRSLSPSSKTQEIAKGQMELMEMVRNLPESFYELSLRDIVEGSKSQEDSASQERRDDWFDKEEAMSRSDSGKRIRQNSRKGYLAGNAQMVRRSGSMNNGGLLLKMVYPASSLRSKQKRRNSSSSVASSNSKVSPRPSLSDSPARGLDKDWWKKLSGSGKVEHGILESNPGSLKSSRSNSKNESNRREDARVGCWRFYRKKKGASRE